MLMLAINHSQNTVVRELVDMGADIQSTLRQLSRNLQFAALSWVFSVEPLGTIRALRTEDIIDLIANISVQRPSLAEKNQQVEILDKLLNIIHGKRSTFVSDSVIPGQELGYILNTFLEGAL
ncbi:unnamed protein product, partial [Fusarium langsethiae]